MDLPDAYLDQLSEYIMDQRSSSLLSQLLVDDIDQMRENLKKDNSVMVFSPKDISVEAKEIYGRQVFDYFGTYYYGFNVNGKFVAVPGDESSVIEQKPEAGVVRIILDEQKNKAETFIESFAGNSFGIKHDRELMRLPRQKISSSPTNPGVDSSGGLKRFVLVAIIVMIGWFIYRSIS